MIDMEAAHRLSNRHRDALLASTSCGCFYCCAMFAPGEVVEWIDEERGVGQTALCPRCGIDAVIGSASGILLTPEFLKSMQEHWF